MNQTERFYKIEQLLHTHRSLSSAQLQQALEVSRATLNRDIAYLRDRLGVPIRCDKAQGGYTLDRKHCSQAELPGLWFSSAEIHALLTMQHLLANLDPGGILTPHVQPLIERLNQLLGAANNPAEEVRRRVLVAACEASASTSGLKEKRMYQRVPDAIARSCASASSPSIQATSPRSIASTRRAISSSHAAATASGVSSDDAPRWARSLAINTSSSVGGNCKASVSICLSGMLTMILHLGCLTD